MSLNNMGMTIDMNVKGNAEGKFGRIGGAFGNFTSKLQGAIPGFKNIFSGLDKLTTKFQGFTNLLPQGLGGMVGKLAPIALGITALTFAFRTVTSTIHEADVASTNFQKGMAEVSTLLDKETMPLMGRLSNEAIELGQRFGQSTDIMSKATYQAISAGINARESSKFMGIAGKLAVGGVTDMETAVDGLTSIKNAWGLTMGDMTKVSDQMFVAMRAGKTTIGELSNSIGQVAPIAAQMGIGLDQVLSMTATLTKGGLTTSESMTGIRQAMAEVMKQSPKFTKAVEQYGLKADEATIKQMGFANWLAYANKRVTEQGGKISDLFRSIQGLSAILTLTGKGMADNIDIMKQMQHYAGQNKMAFAKMADTLAFRTKQMEVSRQAFMIKLGDILTPFIKGSVKFKTIFFNTMTEVLEFTDNNFIKPMQKIMEPFIIIIGVAFSLLFGRIKTNLKFITTIWTMQFKQFILPIKIISTVLMGLIKGFRIGFEMINTKIEIAREAIQPLINSFNALKDVIGFVFKISLADNLGTAIGFGFSKLSGLFDWIVKKMENISGTINDIIMRIPENVANVYQSVMSMIVKFTTWAQEKVLELRNVLPERFGGISQSEYDKEVKKLESVKKGKLEDISFNAKFFQVSFELAMENALKKYREESEKAEKERADITNGILREGNEINKKNKPADMKEWESAFLWRDFNPIVAR
jgi:TP901 family phage tail tape measure protein